MGDSYGKARMQSPGTAERLTLQQIQRKKAGLSIDGPPPSPPAMPAKPVPPVAQAMGAVGQVQKGMARLRGETQYESESHAYDWRSRNNLKRGQ